LLAESNNIEDFHSLDEIYYFLILSGEITWQSIYFFEQVSSRKIGFIESVALLEMQKQRVEQWQSRNLK
jgi:hypothetical protein